MFKKFLLVLFLTLLAVPSFGWEGKVIGIRDCHAIVVFDGTNLPVTVFLEGVDQARGCPPGAGRFVSKSVFYKQVEVKDERKTDGGIVAEVVMQGGKSLNKELLQQDFMRHEGRETPVAAMPQSDESPGPAQEAPEPAASSESAKKDSSPAAEQYREPSPVSGVRRWRDEDGNIHFSGTVRGKK
jgi:hypothetical protein